MSAEAKGAPAPLHRGRRASGSLAALDDYLAADYQRHVSPTAPPLSLEGQKQRLAGFRAAFPDIKLTLEDVFAEDDRVVFRSTMRGTHEGEFQGIPPTGARVTVAAGCHRLCPRGPKAELVGAVLCRGCDRACSISASGSIT